MELGENIQKEAKDLYLTEIVRIGTVELLLFSGLVLPWVTFPNSQLFWNITYQFDNIYTWPLIFGDLAPYMTSFTIIFLILMFHLALSKPILSGFLLLVQYICNALIFLTFCSYLWSYFIGIGFYITSIPPIIMIIIGIWKRGYQAKLGIRKPKTRIYNIDRWLRLKIQEEGDLDSA